MEFIRFIFSGFWVWFGFVILLLLIAGLIENGAKSLILFIIKSRIKRNVKLNREGDRFYIEIGHANSRDIFRLLKFNRQVEELNNKGEGGKNVQ